MDPEDVMKLFDSCWFDFEILKKDRSIKSNQSSSSEPRFSSLRSILVRSHSEDIGSFNYGSFSPNSVLFTSHLESIPSSKSDSTEKKQEQVEEAEIVIETKTITVNTDRKDKSVEQEMKKKKNRRHGFSKSLSDLEFEELKGFMDLGFVFSEEDKASSLVDIIPGLQRLGDERESDHDKGSCSSTCARRPYLSEAWENMDTRLQTPLLNWEIPVVRDEIDMKDNLKLWAHTVASYVR